MHYFQMLLLEIFKYNKVYFQMHNISSFTIESKFLIDAFIRKNTTFSNMCTVRKLYCLISKIEHFRKAKHIKR